MNQNDLLKIIYETGFALDDTVLFLDTHPDCEEALSYYHKMKKIHEQAFSDYQENYGPLLDTGVTCKNKWEWVNTPWPWEGV